MRKLFIAAALVAASVLSARAQSDDSRAEFFAGYSVLRTDVTVEDIRSPLATNDEPLKNLQGFNVAATGYLTPRFGLTGDFSAHFKTEEERFEGVPAVVGAPTGARYKGRAFNILGGPQFRFSNSTRVTPFVRALAGVQNSRVETELIGGAPPFVVNRNTEIGGTDFALALGGGLDVRLGERFAIRAFQIDYNPTFARDRTVNILGTPTRFEGGRTDNVRFSVGVVFK